VRVVIAGENASPVAVDDAVESAEESTATVDVAANDSDEDGNLDAATTTLLIAPTHGTVVNHGDGSFAYTPALNFHGSDHFTYEICDDEGLCASASVNITVTPVNDAPLAEDDAYEALEDSPLTLDAPAILSNDSDVDGDDLSVTPLLQPAHGLLALNANGSLTYTPAANFCGADSYRYTLADGEGGEASATVSIAVACVADAPVAVADSYALDEDSLLSVDAPGLLENDTDADGDALSLMLVSGPTQGKLAEQSDGSFVYTPAPNLHGSDSFIYQANDGSANSNNGVVTLTINPVNDAPSALAEAFSVGAGERLSLAAPGVLANDTDIEDDPLVALLVTAPEHGALSLAGGWLLYLYTDPRL
jgi:hypothetical protein